MFLRRGEKKVNLYPQKKLNRYTQISHPNPNPKLRLGALKINESLTEALLSASLNKSRQKATGQHHPHPTDRQSLGINLGGGGGKG